MSAGGRRRPATAARAGPAAHGPCTQGRVEGGFVAVGGPARMPASSVVDDRGD